MSEQKLPGQDAVNPLHKGEGVGRRREGGREEGHGSCYGVEPLYASVRSVLCLMRLQMAVEPATDACLPALALAAPEDRTPYEKMEMATKRYDVADKVRRR